MSLDFRKEALTPTALSEHAAIPIAFVVDRVLEVRLLDGGLGGMSLTEIAVTDPYVKDYDAIEGAAPQCWSGHFDVSDWGLICARRDGVNIGGAVIAIKTPGLHMLDARDDVAVLWDIRVLPRERGGGVGSALFRAAEDWAGACGCRWLKIETQNVNVPACRFYQKMGCTLSAIWGSPIPASQPRRSCCGGRHLRRRTPNPVDLSSALNLKLLRQLPRRSADRRPIQMGSKPMPLMDMQDVRL